MSNEELLNLKLYLAELVDELSQTNDLRERRRIHSKAMMILTQIFGGKDE